MKKFEFKLEKLLSYKDQMVDSEMMNLAILNNQLQEAEDRLSSLKEEQRKYEDDFVNKMAGRITPAACRIYSIYSGHLNQQVKDCQRDVVSCKEQVEKQIDLIKELKIEAKSIETIKEYKLDEYTKEGIKKSERDIEEFVSTRKISNMAFQ